MVLETHMKLCMTDPHFLEEIFVSKIVPDMWPRILSANQIAKFFNTPYLQKKSLK